MKPNERILDSLLQQGILWYDAETKEFLGRADDGAIVCVGDSDHADETEQYLSTHKTPDTW